MLTSMNRLKQILWIHETKEIGKSSLWQYTLFSNYHHYDCVNDIRGEIWARVIFISFTLSKDTSRQWGAAWQTNVHRAVSVTVHCTLIDDVYWFKDGRGEVRGDEERGRVRRRGGNIWGQSCLAVASVTVWCTLIDDAQGWGREEMVYWGRRRRRKGRWEEEYKMTVMCENMLWLCALV